VTGRPRSRWDLIGSRRSLGLTAFLVTAPIGFFAAWTATREPFASTQVLLLWCVIGVLSQVVLGAVLFVGYVLVGDRNGRKPSTRAIVIAFVLLAAAARGVVIAVLPAMWDLSTTATPAVRIGSSTIIFGLWLMIIGAALAANDQYRANVSRLLDELVTRELAERLLDEAQADVHATRALQRIAETSSHVTRVLDDSAVAADSARTAALVQQEIEERLRPLSHEMWFSPAPQLEAPDRTRPFLLRVLATPVPFGRALPLMTCLLVLNSLVWHGGSLGLLQGLTAAAVTALIVVPFTLWGGAHRMAANAVMYLLLFLLPAELAHRAMEFATGVPQREPAALALAVGIPLAFFIGAMGHTVIADRQATMTSLRASIAEPMWDEHLGTLERRSADSDAATFLHNTIQSRLFAAALQLENAAAANDPEGAERAIAQAREAVAMTGMAARGAAPMHPLMRLDQIALAWQGIAIVELHVSDDVTAGAGWQIAADVIEEAVANSIRHGGASHITVTCQEVDGVIDVTVEDNGFMSDDPSGTGLGLTWLDAATGGDWSLTPGDFGTTLNLRIRA
jgi:hypothetical protein